MAQSNSLPQMAAKHFVSIEQLSLHNTSNQTGQAVAPQTPSIMASLPPLSPGASSFLLFILLFSCAIGIQILKGVSGIKNYIVAFVLALVVASIPVVLDYVNTGGGQQAKAGPQEVPKKILVEYQRPGEVVITWNTEVDAYGGVRFARAPYTIETSRFLIADSGEKTKTHHVILDNLVKNHTYQFEILSGINWYAHEDTYISFTFAP